MRTTVILPDDLYQQVRLTATSEQRTVTSVIEQALRETLAARAAAPVSAPFRVDVIDLGGALRPGVDLDDNASLEDLMDGPAAR